MQPATYRPIGNPVTGDRCQILEISADELRLHFWIAPGSNGAPLHFHQSIAETFHVKGGVMTLELDRHGGFSELHAGSSVVIAPGRLHSFSNPRKEWLVFEAHLRPPAGFLTFLLGLYGLAGAGKVDAAGTPKNPLALLRLLTFGDIWLPGVPVALQRGLFRAVGWLSKSLHLEGQLLEYRTVLMREACEVNQEVRP